MNKKIILLLYPPIVNKFDFLDHEEIKFINLIQLKKNVWQSTELDITELDKYFDLVNIKIQQKIHQAIEEEKLNKIILVNNPLNLKYFQLLREELSQCNQDINHIILINVINYELVLEIQKDYLICPLCEHIYWKIEAERGDKFICPRDSECSLDLNQVVKFSELFINYYLENSKKIVSKFLEKKFSSNSVIQLSISNKEEIFNGEIQKKILEIINNID